MVIGLGTLGAQLGHSWGKKLLGAHLGQKQLGHTWGQLRQKSDLKHSFCKLNTLGAHLRHKVTRGTLGADTAIHCYLLLHQKIVYLSHFCPKCVPAGPQLYLPQVCPKCAPSVLSLHKLCSSWFPAVSAPIVPQLCPKCAQPDYQIAHK